MLRAALRDLQWRRRRFAITIVGTALVFAMSLLMSGLGNAFDVEVDRTLDQQQAVTWIDHASAAGPFSSGTMLSSDDIAAIVASAPPGARVSPVLFAQAVVRLAGDEVVNVNVLGVEAGGLGSPSEVAVGSAVVPKSLGLGVGDTLSIGDTDYPIAAEVDKASLVAGTPTVTLALADAQALLFDGLPVASMLLSDTAFDPPPAYRSFDRAATVTDLMRPMESPKQSIDFVKVLLWMVAALIVASVVYLTVLERTRDIAVFKATGSSTWSIGAGICLQAVILAVIASIIGVVVAVVLAPQFPMDVTIARSSLVLLPFLAVVVGVVAGMIGVRRTTGIEPAVAFGGP